MTLRNIIAATLGSLAIASAFAAPVITPVTTESGINMLGEVNASEYTLDITFSLNNIMGWRKIVDFNNRTDDAGLYLYWDKVSFATTSESWFDGFGSAGAESGTRLTLTRDNTGVVSAYLNGSFQLSFNDSTNKAVFGSSGGQTSAWLLADDVLFDGREQPTGTITSVKVFDHALTANQIAAVPEPETMALVAAGLLTAFTLGRRRQHKN